MSAVLGLMNQGITSLEDVRRTELEDATGIIEWGLWSRGGLPSGKPNKGRTPNITDDEALGIDAAIGSIIVAMPRAGHTLKRIYIGGANQSELSFEFKISRDKVSDYQMQGLNALYGKLCV